MDGGHPHPWIGRMIEKDLAPSCVRCGKLLWRTTGRVRYGREFGKILRCRVVDRKIVCWAVCGGEEGVE